MTTQYRLKNGGTGDTGVVINGITNNTIIPGETNLAGKDLSNANLTDADLSGMVFTGILPSIEQIGEDLSGSDAGKSVSVSEDGSTIAITLNNAVKIYQKDTTSESGWSQIGSDISGSNPRSVSMSNNGQRIAIGYSLHDSNNLTNCGKVIVYKLDGGNWEKDHGTGVFDFDGGIDAYSSVDNDFVGTAAGDNFGESISLSGDGNILAIGIYGYTIGTAHNSGQVKVYQYDGDAWYERAELLPMTFPAYDQNGLIGTPKEGSKYGISVSLSKDGKRLAVGAPDSDGNKGKVYIYLDYFTENNDGNPNYNNENNPVTLYNRFRLIKEFEGTFEGNPNYDGSSAQWKLGYSVSLNSDGKYIAFGEIGYDPAKPAGSNDPYWYEQSHGRVRVYKDEHDNHEYTNLTHPAMPNNGQYAHIKGTFTGSLSSYTGNSGTYDVGDQLGGRVSFSNDASILAVTGQFRDHSTGIVRVYQKVGNDNNSYTQITELIGENQNALFGLGLSVSGDGKSLIIGAEGSDKVKVYELKKSLSTVNLSGADLTGADLQGIDLSGADLPGADLQQATLTNVNFSGADLSGANFGGVDLTGLNLSGADLSGANLSNTSLNVADLSGADLSGAFLTTSILAGADLSGADLSGADLTGARLDMADLSDANIFGAHLTGAILNHVTWTNLDNYKTNEQYNEKVAEIAAKDIQITNQQNTITTHEGTIATHEGTIQTHEGTIATHLATIQTQNTELANRQNTINTHLATIAAKDTELNTRQNTIDSQAALIVTHEGTIATQNTELGNRQDTIDTQSQNIINHLETIAARDNELNTRQETINTHLATIAAREATIAEREATIDERDGTIQTHEGTIAGLETQVGNSPIDLSDNSFTLSDVITLVNDILS